MNDESSSCFTKCNDAFKSIDPNRTYCKKGCKADEEKEECSKNVCEKLCIKHEIGDEENKWGSKILVNNLN